MDYRGIHIHYIPDEGIERVDQDGADIVCSGYFCMVETNDYDDYIDYFCAAVGHEIETDSEENIEKYIRQYIDDNYDWLIEALRECDNEHDESDDLEL